MIRPAASGTRVCSDGRSCRPMPDDRKPSPLELGLYARAETEPRVTVIEIVAGVLTLVWLLAVAFFGFGRVRCRGWWGRWRLGRSVLAVLAVLLPVGADLGGGRRGQVRANPAAGGQPPPGLHRRDAHRLCGAAAERRAQHQARASAPVRGIDGSPGHCGSWPARHLHLAPRACAARNTRSRGRNRRARMSRSPASPSRNPNPVSRSRSRISSRR
jgi:hypothetical protein